MSKIRMGFSCLVQCIDPASKIFKDVRLFNWSENKRIIDK
jgi:hypothetical protein